jgi:hypothetical protein
MSQSESSQFQFEDARDVLINAIEVELAVMNAAVSFWRQWIEHTSNYVKIAGMNLSSMRSNGKDANQVLMEVVDASRETARLMTELPKKAADTFLSELDAIERRRGASTKPSAKRRARAKP